MRYIKPHYYDTFRCIADQCPATCCAGWQIVIDEDSLEKYSRICGSFGNRIKNSVDWEEGIFYQYDRRCAFLNEQNLCDLQSELGEDALCDTCRKYPRHVEEYEGLREYSLSLSCPVAADMMLKEKEPVSFQEWETDEEDAFEEFDFLMFTQLEDARDVMFQMIQNREVDLRIRMKKILNFAHKLQSCIDEERSYDVDGITEVYRIWSEEGWKKEREKDWEKEENGENKAAESIPYDKMVKNFSVFYKMEHLHSKWTKRLDDAWKVLYERGESHYRDIWNQFHKAYGYHSVNKKEWERTGEQLLMFFVYTYFCGAVYDDMIYTKIALSVFSVVWIQEFYMALWITRQGKVDMEEMIETAYSYAREVEHSDLNLDILEEWLDKA
ncbi:MAG: flagellin lysine-N-methylase [Oliverpabstia sp.]